MSGDSGKKKGYSRPKSYSGMKPDRTRNQDQRNKTPGSPHKFNQNKPKALPFEDYWSKEKVQEGLKRKTLFEAPLRINPKSYEDAYVPHPDGVSDVYICGIQHRNRALNGDVVVIELLERQEWKALVADINDATYELTGLFSKLSQDDSGSSASGEGHSIKSGNTPKRVETPSTSDSAALLSPINRQRPPQFNGNTPTAAAVSSPKRYTALRDLSECGSGSPLTHKLFTAEQKQGMSSLDQRFDALPSQFMQRTGKIVYISEQKHSRACTGHLKLFPDKNKDKALFIATDYRLPRLFIPITDCPPQFYTRPQDYASTLFIARVTEWCKSGNMANGQLLRSLGEAGEIEPETDGILVEYGVDAEPFSQEVLNCLPDASDVKPWCIPEAEFAYRRDLRHECIFTIDPASARDLDDALHCKHLGGDEYEVGVHIADVSHFVHAQTALDEVAASRSTSVYLVQKVIPMLPRLLCEQLCSLNPDSDRLTFSVIWRMNSAGVITDEWFGRSVIRTVTKLSYDHAQGFIENPEREFTADELPRIAARSSIAEIQQGVLNLQKIAKNMREKRFDDGALALNQVKLSFLLNRESGLPCGYSVYNQRDSNRLVEEFMLLANMAVSHKIYNSFPELAILRRHPPPQSRMIDELQQTLRGIGIEIDVTSAKGLQSSLLSQLSDDSEKQGLMSVLTVMASKPMQLARYFCAGMIEDEDAFRHYALNVPLYTHFTSPIRRYPDIMVHRLLAAALDYSQPPTSSPAELMHQCEHCNDKKKASKTVQEMNSEMFFAIFVRECGPLEERGIVMTVLDKSFDVLVLRLGVVKRVYLDKLALKGFTHRKMNNGGELMLTWAVNEDNKEECSQKIAVFKQVNCQLLADDLPLKWRLTVKHPAEPLLSSQSDANSQPETEVVRPETNITYEDL